MKHTDRVQNPQLLTASLHQFISVRRYHVANSAPRLQFQSEAVRTKVARKIITIIVKYSELLVGLLGNSKVMFHLFAKKVNCKNDISEMLLEIEEIKAFSIILEVS